ncbi:MAG: IPT/TIG domain-containing protein, partial [Acidobacteriota bacterium]
TAEGCLMLPHNGPPGTVTATFTAIGDGNDIGLESAFEGGPAFPVTGMMMFPGEGILQPGESTPVVLMTGGATGPFTFGASDGTIEPLPTSDPDVYGVTYTADDEEGGPDTVTITVTSPTGSASVQVEIQKVKLDEIETFNAQNASTEGRINPDGGTTFLLTGKKDFPAVPLKVRFQDARSSLSVEVEIPLDDGTPTTPRPALNKLRGKAPANAQFIGDAKTLVLTQDGTQISKKSLCKKNGKDCSAYYSFDPPSPATSLSVPGFNRLGGNLTITAAGGGFRVFQSSVTQNIALPRVDIGNIDFKVNLVTEGTPSTINGNVRRAGPEIQSCVIEGESPCKKIKVKNPGGRDRDEVRSLVDLYTLMAGPPPTPVSLSRSSGQSTGGTEITVEGDDLDFVKEIIINTRKATIDEASRSRTRLKFTTPGNCNGTFGVVFKGIDRLDATLSGFTYLHTLSGTRPFEEGVFGLTVSLGGTVESEVLDPITIGPCETLTINPSAQTARCLTFRVKVDRIQDNGQRRIYFLRLEADARSCDISNVPSPVPFPFFYDLVNGPESRRARSDVNIIR